LPHNLAGWAYYFPYEESDKDSADMKDAMIEMLCGRSWLAPIDEPQCIFELGVGTGKWAIDGNSALGLQCTLFC